MKVLEKVSGRSWTSFSVLGLVLPLALTACGGGGGGGSGGPGPEPQPPPPTATLKAADDSVIGVLASGFEQPIAVLGNDGDPNAMLQCVSETTRGGQVSLSADGKRALYAPANGFTGTDRFAYRVMGQNGGVQQAVVAVRVDADERTFFEPEEPLPPEQQIASIEGDPPLDPVIGGKAGHDYATTSVLPIGRTVVFAPKPPLVHDNDRKSPLDGIDVHRVELRRGTSYDVRVQYPTRSYDAFSVDGLSPSLELLDFDANRVALAIADLKPTRALRDIRPRRTEDHYVLIWSDYFPNGDIPADADDRYYVTVVVRDDYTGTTDTTGVAGGLYPLRAALEQPGDTDWFRVDLDGGEQYYFSAAGQPTGLMLDLRDASGAVVARDDGHGNVTFTAPGTATATYFVVVASSSAATGAYELTSDGGDVPGTVETYASLTIGEPVIGRLKRRTDVDWFAVTLEAGHHYVATVTGHPSESDWIADPRVRVHDAYGEPLLVKRTRFGGVCGGTCETKAQLLFTAPYSGRYFVSASTYDGDTRDGTAREGIFETDIAERATGRTLGDDFSDDAETVGYANTRFLLKGVIDQSGDVDWFRLYVDAGETYVVHVDAAGSNGSLGAADVRLLDANGQEIERAAADGNGTLTLDFRPPFSGDVYVAVSGAGGATGGYTLRRDRGDTPSSARTWGRIGFNGVEHGEIYYVADLDDYRVVLDAEHTYEILMEPDAEALVGAIGGGKVTLRGADYAPLNDATAGGARLTIAAGTAYDFRPADHGYESGTFFLSLDGDRFSGGAYRLSIRDLSAPESCVSL